MTLMECLMTSMSVCVCVCVCVVGAKDIVIRGKLHSSVWLLTQYQPSHGMESLIVHWLYDINIQCSLSYK